MVTRRPIDFLRDEDGISLTEAMLTFPIVMLAFAAFVEFGYAMFQWNQTVKALHYGARLAAVSYPVATLPANAVTPADPLDVGATIPTGVVWSCGPETGTACNAELNRIVYGNSGADSCGAVTAKPGMCHLNERIGVNNIVVTYERSGLGYWGRPGGPVLTMRFETRNITFSLPLLGGLLGLDQIEIPAMPVTVTSEDLVTNPT